MKQIANKQKFREWTKRVGGTDKATLILLNELGLSIPTCRRIALGDYPCYPNPLVRRRLSQLIGAPEKELYPEHAS